MNLDELELKHSKELCWNVKNVQRKCETEETTETVRYVSKFDHYLYKTYECSEAPSIRGDERYEGER